MKYVATVEIEFETDVDPLMILYNIIYDGFGKWRDERSIGGLSPPMDGCAKDYQIVEKPMELKS